MQEPRTIPYQRLQAMPFSLAIPSVLKPGIFTRSHASTSIANSVPYEIWELVAGYIPVEERFKLISVSRYFLSIALHERYGNIQWTVLNKEMVWYLERLQEPFIAHHVRKLHIQAWFINFLVRRGELFQGSMKPIAKLVPNCLGFPRPSFGSCFPFLQSRGRPLNKTPKVFVSSRKKKDPSLLSPTQVLALMIRALSNMTNLTSYSFKWRDLPLNRDSEIFLTTAQSCARRLRSLVLHAQLPKFQYLLNFVDFENLEDLKFHFDYETHVGGSDSEDIGAIVVPEASVNSLTAGIARFINRFTLSLHSLTISSTATAPLNTLFDAPTTFPNLRYFELHMGFDDTVFPSIESLLNFLTAHSSSLFHVKFIPPQQRGISTNLEAIAEAKVAAWSRMHQLLRSSAPVVLSHLETLYLPASAPLETTLLLLRRSVGTLTHLCLSGHYFSFQELNQILGEFSGRPLHSSMQYFRVEVVDLSFTVLAAIAARFPYLHRLVIITQRPLEAPMDGTWLDPFLLFTPPSDPTINYPEAFRSFRPIAILADWRLCDLGIYFERFQQFQTASFATSRNEHMAMLALRKIVPSIQYFKGQDPLSYDWPYQL